MSDDPQLLSAVEQGRVLLKQGADQERILQSFRDAGLWRIQSIMAAMRVFDMDLAQAKREVYLSQTWADRYAATEAFPDESEAAVAQINADDLTQP